MLMDRCAAEPMPGGNIRAWGCEKTARFRFTRGLKFLAALPLARWKMRSRFRINGQAAKLVSVVAVHGHAGKTEVADY